MSARRTLAASPRVLERDSFNSGFRPRHRRDQTPRPTGEPSKTRIYVANLPWSLDEAALEQVFEGHQVTDCTIIRTRAGEYAGQSRGFGFVTFATEEDQAKVLEAFNGKEVEGRPLRIHAATGTPIPPQDRRSD